MKRNRWYDKNKDLSKFLDSFKEMNAKEKDGHILNIMSIIKDNAPNLLEEFVADFPFDILRRRWYDNDPYLWLLFNGLKYANNDLIRKIVNYFKDTIE